MIRWLVVHVGGMPGHIEESSGSFSVRANNLQINKRIGSSRSVLRY